ncbi:uncharacterized protein Z520_10475 [Fonsecaea multimorphosa CBS 102226]|uniref:Uncharacterized protein n=1 Tax=Fonsecaea multimorphosa CBS 102226 TaxID=1442371 RepID=A0A0D2GW66_9EURO|nr:uncharacterized protein Z520_10475 [Fonsecaea multimorphosa CBS 102226]KIX93850.1 hypothetical protein Z520_10475 [Fonsecaea multimorphosa CBS 102226]OAL19089.1 hypothetical protein AYO22_10037 [Fonsecaea multimorphosa]
MASASDERSLMFRLERVENICATLMGQLSQSPWRPGLEQNYHAAEVPLSANTAANGYGQFDVASSGVFPSLLLETVTSPYVGDYDNMENNNSSWPGQNYLSVSQGCEPRPVQAAAEVAGMDEFAPLPASVETRLNFKPPVRSMAFEYDQAWSQSTFGYLEPSITLSPHIRTMNVGDPFYTPASIRCHPCEANNSRYLYNHTIPSTQDGISETIESGNQPTTRVSFLSTADELRNGGTYYSEENSLGFSQSLAGHDSMSGSYQSIPVYRDVQLRYEDREVGFHPVNPAGKVDQYIEAMGHLFAQFTSTFTSIDGLAMLAFEGTSWVLHEAWPTVEIFWELIGAREQFSLVELWRNAPCLESYRRLPPYYRPTEVQLCIPHSPFIDWLPWPDLREQLILLQPSTQIDSDVVVRTAIQNAVSQRCVPSTPAGKGDIPANRGAPVAASTSFRLWELCLLEKQGRQVSTQGTSAKLYRQKLSPSIASLCKVYGLRLTDIPGTQLDPAFFDMYPSLRCDNVRSRFQVQRLGGIAPVGEIDLPVDISSQRLQRLERRMAAAHRQWMETNRQ